MYDIYVWVYAAYQCVCEEKTSCTRVYAFTYKRANTAAFPCVDLCGIHLGHWEQVAICTKLTLATVWVGDEVGGGIERTWLCSLAI